MDTARLGQSDVTPADRYAHMWVHGDACPDLSEFLSGFPGREVHAEVAEVVLVDQSFRWRKRCEVTVEEYLDRWPILATDAEARLDLIYGELRAMVERGEVPDPSSSARRFPDLAELLERHIRRLRVGLRLTK